MVLMEQKVVLVEGQAILMEEQVVLMKEQVVLMERQVVLMGEQVILMEEQVILIDQVLYCCKILKIRTNLFEKFLVWPNWDSYLSKNLVPFLIVLLNFQTFFSKLHLLRKVPNTIRYPQLKALILRELLIVEKS